MMKKQKILIIDDSKLNREILANMLGDYYEIDEAENGAQALEILTLRSSYLVMSKQQSGLRISA